MLYPNFKPVDIFLVELCTAQQHYHKINYQHNIHIISSLQLYCPVSHMNNVAGMTLMHKLSWCIIIIMATVSCCKYISGHNIILPQNILMTQQLNGACTIPKFANDNNGQNRQPSKQWRGVTRNMF